jgi:GT2 family glycosyltransferase
MPIGLSIVVPVHNGVGALTRCLAAITARMNADDELIVVDDGSTEDVRSVAAPLGNVIRIEPCAGVAAARNRGAAAATRPILCFLDADVVIHADTLALGRERMSDPAIDALIGSYDDAPDAPSIVSRFKNLAHHYFHQRAAGPVSSFWGACGFIRRDVFTAAGGFDERRFSEPSIEDVELGWRLTDRGARIVLDPRVQVTHLKRWTLRSLVFTDVVRRAMPWVRWSIERRQLPAELNASIEQRLAAPLAVALVMAAVLALFSRLAWLPLAAMLIAAVALNRGLWRLFWRKGGWPLLVAGFFLQQLYYLCALTGLAAGAARYGWR